MSRIERKYCLISTSCLAGLSDIFILLHILHNCMYFGVFSPIRTPCDDYHKGFESHKRSIHIWQSQFFTIRTDPKPVNNLFIFFQALKRKKHSRKKTHAGVTVTVVRDRKIRTALRTNQIVGFVTMPAWKKNK